MKSIYKYPIHRAHREEIILPLEQILTVQLQNHIPCLWAMIDDDKPKKKIAVWIIGTGWDLSPLKDKNLIYISTVQDESGFVWYFFYEIIEE